LTSFFWAAKEKGISILVNHRPRNYCWKGEPMSFLILPLPAFPKPDWPFPEDFFPSFKPAPWFQQQSLATLLKPSLDVLDTGKAVLVTMPKPAVPLKDIQTEVKGGLLTIRGQSQSQQRKEEKHSAQSQFNHSSFFHQVRLPTEVDPKKIEMHVDEKNNLLILTLPKINATSKPKNEQKAEK
jgi:HSP20 family molecular chaperone IbpA